MKYLAAFIVLASLAIPFVAAVASDVADARGDAPTEADFYPMTRLPIPEDQVIEPGGLELMPDGKLAVSSRRGEIWMVDNPFGKPEDMRFHLWAQGLHEVLGIHYHDGWLYATQRPEVTKIKDLDHDGRADLFLTVNDDWQIIGNYHEYAFGSNFDSKGNMYVVLCLTGSFTSEDPYRGWCVQITPEGKMVPYASGVRSPGGITVCPNDDIFFCDNQGPWNGTSSLKHVTKGSFQGNPTGLRWYDLPEVQAALGKRPEDPKDNSRFHIEWKRLPQYRPPACLLPHGKVGQSSSGIAYDDTTGKFGPFAGQLFVSDQTFSQVNRVFLEKINGLYQGVVIPFRVGFGSGNVPTIMTKQGSLFVGGTARGWGARGGQPYALDRVDWSGKIPFEIHEMRIKPDGFELTFTKPVDPATAGDIASYTIETYTYLFRASYGSPEVDPTTPTIKSATVAPDGKSVRLVVDGLEIGHVHELHLPGLRSKAEHWPLLHPVAYYTIWQIPTK